MLSSSLAWSFSSWHGRGMAVSIELAFTVFVLAFSDVELAFIVVTVVELVFVIVAVVFGFCRRRSDHCRHQICRRRRPIVP